MDISPIAVLILSLLASSLASPASIINNVNGIINYGNDNPNTNYFNIYSHAVTDVQGNCVQRIVKAIGNGVFETMYRPCNENSQSSIVSDKKLIYGNTRDDVLALYTDTPNVLIFMEGGKCTMKIYTTIGDKTTSTPTLLTDAECTAIRQKVEVELENNRIYWEQWNKNFQAYMASIFSQYGSYDTDKIQVENDLEGNPFTGNDEFDNENAEDNNNEDSEYNNDSTFSQLDNDDIEGSEVEVSENSLNDPVNSATEIMNSESMNTLTETDDEKDEKYYDPEYEDPEENVSEDGVIVTQDEEDVKNHNNPTEDNDGSEQKYDLNNDVLDRSEVKKAEEEINENVLEYSDNIATEKLNTENMNTLTYLEIEQNYNPENEVNEVLDSEDDGDNLLVPEEERKLENENYSSVSTDINDELDQEDTGNMFPEDDNSDNATKLQDAEWVENGPNLNYDNDEN